MVVKEAEIPRPPPADCEICCEPLDEEPCLAYNQVMDEKKEEEKEDQALSDQLPLQQ